MSEAEARKWEARYRESSDPPHPPSPFIAAWIARLQPGPALDVGCGTGRHALALARAGFAITGIDVSAAALARARQQADTERLHIDWQQADLDDTTLPSDRYGVIVNCQILKRELLAQYPAALCPGGVVLVEQHLLTPVPVAGPGPRYRLRPGELPGLLGGLRVIHYEETLLAGADRPVALVRAAAVREPWRF